MLLAAFADRNILELRTEEFKNEVANNVAGDLTFGSLRQIYCAMPRPSAPKGRNKPADASQTVRFEAAKVDSLFPILDAIAWLSLPSVAAISQFAGIDARTTGKVLKNCALL